MDAQLRQRFLPLVDAIAREVAGPTGKANPLAVWPLFRDRHPDDVAVIQEHFGGDPYQAVASMIPHELRS